MGLELSPCDNRVVYLKKKKKRVFNFAIKRKRDQRNVLFLIIQKVPCRYVCICIAFKKNL